MPPRVREIVHPYPWQWATKLVESDLSLRLPFDVDAAALKRDLDAALEIATPRAHFRGAHYKGSWAALGLVTPGGDAHELRMLDGVALEETPLFSRCHEVRRLLSRLPQTKRVRFMFLGPRATIRWHFDENESIDRDLVRLHVPVRSTAEAWLQIGHVSCRWREGQLWYGDFSFPHRGYNGASVERVHLVIDVVVDEEVRSWFPAGLLARRRTRELARRLAQRLCRAGCTPRDRWWRLRESRA